MTTSYFMPTSDGGKADLLDHLASNLPRYKDLLTLSDETCASVSADAKSFRYTCQTMNDMQAYAHHWTVYKNQLRDDISTNILPLWPMAITFVVTRPDAVQFGVEGEAGVSATMRERDIRLSTSVGVATYYMGFNMLDPVVGGAADAVSRERARKLRQATATYENNRDLITIGAYQRGSDPRIDQAIARWPQIETFMRQDMHERVDLATSISSLTSTMAEPPPGATK